jgi:hypothetical protein
VSATRYADHFVLTQGPFQHWQSALIVIPESKRSAADKITLGQQSLGWNVAELTPFHADCSRNPSADLWITEASI